MSAALWIVGCIALLFWLLCIWLGATCGNTDGDIGQAWATVLFGVLGAVFSLTWGVLALIHRWH